MQHILFMSPLLCNCVVVTLFSHMLLWLQGRQGQLIQQQQQQQQSAGIHCFVEHHVRYTNCSHTALNADIRTAVFGDKLS
jgi:hypothetical protein